MSVRLESRKEYRNPKRSTGIIDAGWNPSTSRTGVSPLRLSGMSDAFPIASSEDFALACRATQPKGSGASTFGGDSKLYAWNDIEVGEIIKRRSVCIRKIRVIENVADIDVDADHKKC